jgi:outer membrane protein
MNMKTCLAAVVAVAVLPTFAGAQDAPDQDLTFTYGIGVVGLSGVYGGQDGELLPFPVLGVSYGQWSLSIAKGIQFQAIATPTTRLSFALVYDLAADMPDTQLFADLDREDGAAFEIEGSHDFGIFDIAAVVRRDVSQRHDGVSGDLSIGRSTVIGQTLFEARAGASYLNQNYGNAFYGVAASEANALRASYDLGESWSPFVEFSAIVPINDTASFVAGFRHEHLSKDITNSPLVDADERTTLGLSIIRTF